MLTLTLTSKVYQLFPDTIESKLQSVLLIISNEICCRPRSTYKKGKSVEHSQYDQTHAVDLYRNCCRRGQSCTHPGPGIKLDELWVTKNTAIESRMSRRCANNMNNSLLRSFCHGWYVAASCRSRSRFSDAQFTWRIFKGS